MFHQLLGCCQQVWMGDCCWVWHRRNTVIKPAATPRLYLLRIWERVPVSHRRRGRAASVLSAAVLLPGEEHCNIPINRLISFQRVPSLESRPARLLCDNVHPLLMSTCTRKNYGEAKLLHFWVGNIGARSAFVIGIQNWRIVSAAEKVGLGEKWMCSTSARKSVSSCTHMTWQPCVDMLKNYNDLHFARRQEVLGFGCVCCGHMRICLCCADCFRVCSNLKEIRFPAKSGVHTFLVLCSHEHHSVNNNLIKNKHQWKTGGKLYERNLEKKTTKFKKKLKEKSSKCCNNVDKEI